MRIEVHRVGNNFIAYDDRGQQITDRNILEQISFFQMPENKTSFYINVKVDNTQQNAIIKNVIINTKHT